MNVPELIVRSTLKKLVKQELDVKNPDGYASKLTEPKTA